MSDLRVGQYAALYVSDAGAESVATMTEVEYVEDVNVGMGVEFAERRTRASMNPRRRPTGGDLEITFTLAQEDGDAQFEKIRDARLAHTAVSLCALTAKKDVSGAEGPLGDFFISGFSRSESRADAITYDVTAQVDGDFSWVEISGS